MYFKYFQKTPYDVRGDGYNQELVNLTHFARITSSYLDDITLYSYYTVQDGERPDNVSQRLYGTPEYYWTFFLINKHLINAFDDWPKGGYELQEYCENKYNNLAALAGQISSSEFDPIAGKFEIGETVRGQVTGALGVIEQKYPTLGYIVIRPTSGTFSSNGEGIFGLTSGDFLTTSSIVSRAYAPKYWLNANNEQIRRNTGSSYPYTNFQYEFDKNIEKGRIKVIKKQHIQDVARAFSKEMKNKSS